MKKITLLLCFSCIFFASRINAQVGINNATPHENAALDIKGSNKGLLLPEVSLPGSFTGAGPSTGLIVWNTNGSFSDGAGVYYNNGTPASPSWVKLSTGGTGVTSVSASAPLSSTGGATPVISLSQANTSTNGYLSATDWNSFNNKLTTVSVAARLIGNGTVGNPLDLGNSGVTAGTYTKLTVDQYGRATTGASLAAADIPNLDASKITAGTFPLTRITAGTSGQLLRTNGTAVEWWTPTYLTSFTETDPTWNGTANQTGAIGRTGSVGIGIATPSEKLDVEGNILYQGVIKNNNDAATTYKVTTKRYHVVARYGTMNRNSVAMDMNIINELCGDEDGCTVRLFMRRWSSDIYTEAANKGPYTFTYNNADGRWRLWDNTGVDGNGAVNHIVQWWDCYFTDGTYTSNGASSNDLAKGLSLLNWNSDYSHANKTCEITFED